MEIADLERVQKIIGDLEKKYHGDGFIFRGATKEYSKDPAGDGVNSNLYRRAVKDLKGKHVFDEEHFRLAHLEKSILENVEKILSQNMDNRRVLTSLQHYGGKTSLIDFTRSLPIALFFACNDHMGENEGGENGELIVMQADTLHKNKEIQYPRADDSGGFFKIIPPYPQGYVELVEPAKTDDNKLRVLFQNSVFVRSASGYVEKDEDAKDGNIAKGKYAVEIINKKDKKAIMAYLDKYHGIKPKTIYNDLVGFIANPNNYESFEFCREMGNSLNKTHDYEKSLAYYRKALTFDCQPIPASAVYYAIGLILDKLKRYEEAETSFTEAVKINSNFYQAYFERGKTRVAMKNYPAGIADYETAFELAKKSNVAQYHLSMILAHIKLAKEPTDGTKT